jgi:predicted transcriptional regulator
MSVREICNREVVICRPDDSIQEAVKVMRDQHVGDVIIAEERENGCVPVGILTDRDIVIELLAKEVDLKSVTCADVMSSELITAKEDDEILATIELMRDKGVRRIPVVNQQGGLEGILTVDDMIELLSEQLTDLVRLFGRELNHERAVR